jgi:type VI secretion system secreted protein Hcp
MTLAVVPALLASTAAQNHTPAVRAMAAPVSMVLQPGGNTQCRMAIKGAKQGQFKGQSMAKGQEKWIPCSQFLFAVNAPRDAATGLPTGRRQYAPIVATKEWGAASPQIFQAIATNESLPLVEFEFLRTDPRGLETVIETVTLTNATVSGFKQYIGFPDPGEQPSNRQLEDVSFTFQKIEVTSTEGKTTAMDDWSATR